MLQPVVCCEENVRNVSKYDSVHTVLYLAVTWVEKLAMAYYSVIETVYLLLIITRKLVELCLFCLVNPFISLVFMFWLNQLF